MKILNLCQCTNLGGMEQASRRLMLAMSDHGHCFEVLSLNPLGGLKPLLDRDGIPAEGLPYAGRGGWRSWLPLRRALREKTADALLMTGHHLLTMLALGDRWRGRRVLAIHFHHRGVKPDWQWRLIYALACRRFEAVVFPSEFVRAEAVEIHPPLAQRSAVVRYPMTPPEPPTPVQLVAAKRALGLSPDVPVVGNAGWLIARKRWDVFLDTAARIAALRPDARFVAAGDGPLKDTLVAQATRLGIADKVLWLGWQEQLETFYHALDALLFNSDWDALPVTPQEAMAHAVPVAASVEQGGLREIITDDRIGCLLPIHDTGALAEQIVAWLADPDAARAVGLRGRERIVALSRPDDIARAYEILLAGRGPAAS